MSEQKPTSKRARAFTRREAIAVLGAAGAAVAVGCSNAATSPSGASSSTTTTTTSSNVPSTNATCGVTPSETAGPYPSLADFIRSDIREGLAGTMLTLTAKVVNANNACAPVPNVQVEIWHCDQSGNYSEYGSTSNRTFYRGIQTTNANGEVTFITNYPGWYQGRATHIHIEATSGGRSLKVSQIAFPESINNTVHTSGVYASRGSNPTSNAADGIFADSLSAELVTPVGSVASGYTVTFQLGIQV